MLSRAAELCSIASCVVALTMIAIWAVVFARHPTRRVGGMASLVSTFAVVLIGLAVVLAVVAYASASPFAETRPLLIKAALWIAVVIAALALARAWVVRSLRTYRITLKNEGPQTITSARLEAPGAHLTFASIPPGESSSRSFALVANGRIDLMIRVDEQTHEHRIADAASKRAGEHYVATLKGDVMTFDRIER